jgi:hypothetical protein
MIEKKSIIPIKMAAATPKIMKTGSSCIGNLQKYLPVGALSCSNIFTGE